MANARSDIADSQVALRAERNIEKHLDVKFSFQRKRRGFEIYYLHCLPDK